MTTPYIIVLVTTKDRAQATKISKALLEKKLIACANIIGGVNSLFFWKGKMDSAKETLLVLKTKKNLFKALSQQVKSLHSYETPEIIALPIVAGDEAYLSWINDSVGK